MACSNLKQVLFQHTKGDLGKIRTLRQDFQIYLSIYISYIYIYIILQRTGRYSTWKEVNESVNNFKRERDQGKRNEVWGKRACYIRALYHQQTAGGSICTASVDFTMVVS